MTRFTLYVHSNPTEGREDDFNDWYDNQHVHDLLALDGVSAVRRYRLADTDPAQPGAHRYLAVYEIEADSPDAFTQAMANGARSGTIKMSDALDTSTVSMQFFEQTGAWPGDAATV